MEDKGRGWEVEVGGSGASCREMETPTLALDSYQEMSREVGPLDWLGLCGFR